MSDSNLLSEALFTAESDRLGTDFFNDLFRYHFYLRRLKANVNSNSSETDQDS